MRHRPVKKKPAKKKPSLAQRLRDLQRRFDALQDTHQKTITSHNAAVLAKGRIEDRLIAWDAYLLAGKSLIDTCPRVHGAAYEF